MSGVTVVVATYGDEAWKTLAERAVASVPTDVPLLTVHHPAGSLASARNAGLERVTTDLVCFLDADDELAPDYLEHMRRASADVRVPSVSYVIDGVASPPRTLRVRHCETSGRHTGDCTGDCLMFGNWVVIGAPVRTALVRAVGGFRPWPIYEDYDLFLRLHVAGASFESVPSAVYLAHQDRGGAHRNVAGTPLERAGVQAAIVRSALGDGTLRS